MVLYHIITIYHLLSAIVHRKRFFPFEKASIIMPDFISQFLPKNKFNEIIESKFFDNVFLFPYKNIKKDKNRIFQEVEKSISAELKEIIFNSSDIIVFGAHFYFSLYLIKNKIHFTAGEEASGALSKLSILVDALENVDPFHKMIAEENNLLDYSSPYIDTIICNYNAQANETYKRFKTINFNVVCEMNQLSDIEKQKICFFFEAPKIELSQNTAIVLSQHFMNLNILTYNEQITLYKTFVDYFLSQKNVVVKPHPSDFMPYNILLKKCSMLPRMFPIELFPVLSNGKINTVSTVYSTGIDQIKDYSNNLVQLDMNFRNTYLYADQYYVASYILEGLFETNIQVSCIGVDIAQISAMCKCNFKDRPLHTFCEIGNINESIGTVVLVDDISRTHLTRKSLQQFILSQNKCTCFIFLNSKLDYCWYEYSNREYFDQLIPIQINSCTNKKINEKTIYVYAKDQPLVDKIMEIKMEKKLFNLEKKLWTAPLSEQERNIKILEGKLEATEERLLYYINLVEQLSQKKEEDQ